MKSKIEVPPLKLPKSKDEHDAKKEGYIEEKKQEVAPLTLTSNRWAELFKEDKKKATEDKKHTALDLLRKWSSKEKYRTEAKER